ncbi:hypothetical protein WJX72_004701 [[Myrmecia] bisecta]|uniref:Uncharacterized protein n=1 Tax=[Myrmecia] bisecta TaxID=41462 RepID=A0AAW1QRK1_9CHLO
MVWNATSAGRLLVDRYPWFLSTFYGYKQPAMQANAIRPFILHAHGGVFLDVTVQCLQPVNAAGLSHALLLQTHDKQGRDIGLTVAAGTPNHPFFLQVAKLLEQKAEQLRDEPQSTKAAVKRLTGSAVITEAFAAFAWEAVRKSNTFVGSWFIADAAVRVWDSGSWFPACRHKGAAVDPKSADDLAEDLAGGDTGSNVIQSQADAEDAAVQLVADPMGQVRTLDPNTDDDDETAGAQAAGGLQAGLHMADAADGLRQGGERDAKPRLTSLLEDDAATEDSLQSVAEVAAGAEPDSASSDVEPSMAIRGATQLGSEQDSLDPPDQPASGQGSLDPVDQHFAVPEDHTIPKLLHWVYLGDSAALARAMQFGTNALVQQSCKDVHPAWEHRQWGLGEARQLLQERYAWFLDTFDGYPLRQMQENAIRPFILHAHGGLFLELGMECLEPSDALLAGASLVLQSVSSGSQDISNAVMAGAAGHPYWMQVATSLQDQASLLAQAVPLTEETVAKVTGPAITTLAFAVFASSAIEPSQAWPGTWTIGGLPVKVFGIYSWFAPCEEHNAAQCNDLMDVARAEGIKFPELAGRLRFAGFEPLAKSDASAGGAEVVGVADAFADDLIRQFEEDVDAAGRGGDQAEIKEILDQRDEAAEAAQAVLEDSTAGLVGSDLINPDLVRDQAAADQQLRAELQDPLVDTRGKAQSSPAQQLGMAARDHRELQGNLQGLPDGLSARSRALDGPRARAAELLERDQLSSRDDILHLDSAGHILQAPSRHEESHLNHAALLSTSAILVLALLLLVRAVGPVRSRRVVVRAWNSISAHPLASPTFWGSMAVYLHDVAAAVFMSVHNSSYWTVAAEWGQSVPFVQGAIRAVQSAWLWCRTDGVAKLAEVSGQVVAGLEQLLANMRARLSELRPQIAVVAITGAAACGAALLNLWERVGSLPALGAVDWSGAVGRLQTRATVCAAVVQRTLLLAYIAALRALNSCQMSQPRPGSNFVTTSIFRRCAGDRILLRLLQL